MPYQREKLVSLARELPLVDMCYLVNDYRLSAIGRSGEPLALRELFPDASQAEIESAELHARALRADEYKYGDLRWHDGYIGDQAVLCEMAAKHPSFVSSTLLIAFHNGIFDAMW